MFLRRLMVGLPRSRRLFGSKPSGDFMSAVDELNKEMELVFGNPPSDGFAGSSSKSFINHEPQISPVESTKSAESYVQSQEPGCGSQDWDKKTPHLTHINSSGEAQMVDVSAKESTKRTALATCKVILGKKVFDLVLTNQIAKGDVLGVAKIAGINGAKQTSGLIPLCHNIALTHVRVDLRLDHEDFSVHVEGEASCTGKTGVEMEAMTAVSVAGLTVYDMCKAGSKDIRITDVRLERKSGGKSGNWSREE